MKLPIRWRPVHTVIFILIIQPVNGLIIALGIPLLGFLMIVVSVAWAARIVITEDSQY